MQDASGVPEEEFLPAAKMGVCKVNIDTDGRLVWTRVHREFFRDHPEKFDLRDVGKPFIDEYAKMIAHKNQVLGFGRPTRRRARQDRQEVTDGSDRLSGPARKWERESGSAVWPAGAAVAARTPPPPAAGR